MRRKNSRIKAKISKTAATKIKSKKKIIKSRASKTSNKIPNHSRMRLRKDHPGPTQKMMHSKTTQIKTLTSPVTWKDRTNKNTKEVETIDPKTGKKVRKMVTTIVRERVLP